MTQRLKVVPSYIITSYLAGDYFQALRNITAPAALIVWQQSSLIITLEWEWSLDWFCGPGSRILITFLHNKKKKNVGTL